MEGHLCISIMGFLTMCECSGACLGHLVIGGDSDEKENLDGNSLAWYSQICVASPVMKQ